MRGKSGISAIVATVLIILITVAAVTIVWVAIIPMIKTNLEMGTACLAADVVIDSSSGYTCYDAEKKILAVQIKKGPNEVDVAEVELLLGSGGTSDKMSMPFDLGVNNGKVFYLPVDEDIDEVSLAPVIKLGNSEKTCDITARVNNLKSCSLTVDDSLINNLIAGSVSCLDWLNQGRDEDGTYWIDPDGSEDDNPFEVYCDMTTDGGGWTLVLLSNVNPSTCPQPSLNEVINNLNYNGELSVDLVSFDLFMGLKYWNFIGDEMRVEVGSSPSNIQHRTHYDFYLDESNYYALKMSNQQIDIGSTSPGIYTYHNNRPITTYDADHDINSGNCGTYYNNAAWWYGACWSGNFWGGCGSSYQDKPFWVGSSTEYFDYGSIWVR